MLFRDIRGYDDLKKVLINGVQHEHLAHAQLFAGQEGGAQLPLALAYANYLNCLNPGETDACGVCESCLKNQKFIHPDLHFSFPTSSTKSVKGPKITSEQFMSDWREFLQKEPYGNASDWARFFGAEDKKIIIPVEESRKIIRDLSLKSFEGRYKILLLWLPELMNTSAANALLKILEEPPENTLFLLVSNHPEQLISTISSRLQGIRVRKFSDEEIRDLLQERGISGERAEELVQLADGSFSAAIHMASEQQDSAHEVFAEWMRNCYKHDYAALVKMAEDFQKTSKTNQQSLLLYGLGVFRETLVSHYGEEQLSRMSGDGKGFVEKFKAVLVPDKIEALTGLFNSAAYHLDRNANPKIIFLDLSLQIAQTFAN